LARCCDIQKCSRIRAGARVHPAIILSSACGHFRRPTSVPKTAPYPSKRADKHDGVRPVFPSQGSCLAAFQQPWPIRAPSKLLRGTSSRVFISGRQASQLSFRSSLSSATRISYQALKIQPERWVVRTKTQAQRRGLRKSRAGTVPRAPVTRIVSPTARLRGAHVIGVSSSGQVFPGESAPRYHGCSSIDNRHLERCLARRPIRPLKTDAH